MATNFANLKKPALFVTVKIPIVDQHPEPEHRWERRQRPQSVLLPTIRSRAQHLPALLQPLIS